MGTPHINMDRVARYVSHLAPEAAAASADDAIVIVSAIRTAICRARKGGFRDTQPDALLSAVLKKPLPALLTLQLAISWLATCSKVELVHSPPVWLSFALASLKMYLVTPSTANVPQASKPSQPWLDKSKWECMISVSQLALSRCQRAT